MILIKDGRVIDPVKGIDDILDIVIDKGKIKKIGKYQRSDEYDDIIEAQGYTVAPGLIDVHVHFRDPGYTYKEDINTGINSAMCGGYTTVVMMANTNPTVDNEDTLSYLLDSTKKAPIHVLPTICATKGMKGTELVDYDTLIGEGAVGITDDGKPILDEQVAVKVFEAAKRLGVPVSLHEEDASFIENNGINHGWVSDKLGIGGSDSLAEEVMVARDSMLALHTGAKVNFQHISSGKSVALIRLAKQMGANITAEVTPHHIALDETAVLVKGTLAKMNPPLRTADDRRALIQGLMDGTIDIIATDHAPHSKEEKEKELTEAPSGIIGLETALAVAITVLVRHGNLTISKLIEKMSTNPAKLYNLDAGYLEEGAPADIVIFSENEQWTVPDHFASKAVNCPFIGEKLYGKIKYTMCSGKIVYREDSK